MQLEVISYHELIDSNNSKIIQIIKSALFRTGIVGVRDVPTFLEKSSDYIKSVRKFAAMDETIKRLTPLLTDPNLVQKVDEASSNKLYARVNEPASMSMTAADKAIADSKLDLKQNKKNNNTMAMQSANGNNSMLGQVVGVIIGSPEYQRR